jgi:uncharacterized protein YjbI with pentapeptide repeats
MEDLVALLKAGKVQEFNERRKKRGNIDLFAADLAGAQIPEADLTNANLEKADLSDADLTDANLYRANLSGADLTNTKLESVMAAQSRWREAVMEGCNLNEADLNGADFSDAELIECSLIEATLTGAKAKRTRFDDCKLQGANFTEAKLGGADLSGSILAECTFREASLAGANLSGVVALGADFTEAKMREANLREATLDGANFTGADLSGADLSEATVDDADFTRADLTDAKLDGVDLEGAKLKDALVPAELLLLAMGEIPDHDGGAIDQPTIAANGDRICMLWADKAGGDRSFLRVGVVHAGKPGFLGAPALPFPPSLVRARCLSADGEGFSAVLFVERPGGMVAIRARVGPDGALGGVQQLNLPYTPAAPPLLRQVGPDLLLFGVAREGPGVTVHKLTDGQEPVALHIGRMMTIRTFVSDHHPVLVTKGSTVVTLSAAGLSAPLTVPAEFPGRRGALAPLPDGGAQLLWLEPGQPGIKSLRIGQGPTDEPERLLRKIPCMHLDAGTSAAGAFAAFSRPAPDHAGLLVYAMNLADGKPQLIAERAGRKVAGLHLLTQGAGAPLAVCWDDGLVEIFDLAAPRSGRRWPPAG